MKTTYETVVLGYGNHAAIEVPEKNLGEIGGSKRSPVRVTLNNYSYQSTATVLDGKTLVVFPTKDRLASGVSSGDAVIVTLELIEGYRELDLMPEELTQALRSASLLQVFREQNYSTRKEFARLVIEAKTDATRSRRIDKIIGKLQQRI